MQWIERVERRNGAWGLLVSDDNQEVPLWHPATQMQKLTPAANGTCRRRLTIDLADWRESSAQKYLAALGDKRSPTEGQMVFSFHDNGTEYLVPTIVLIQAFFRPLRHISPWLFHPTSLEHVSAPIGDTVTFSAGLTLTTADQHYKEPIASKELFTWVWAHPSARRMWSSVYLHALDGSLGITLPQGTVRAVFHGIARGHQVAVTEMRVLQITTTERPDLEVPPATNTFNLHAGITCSPTQKSDVEQRLLNNLGHCTRPLTDEEWRGIQDILAPEHTKNLRHLDQRTLLNGVLEKLATGEPWRRKTYQVGDWRHASSAYRKWKVQGLWEEVCTRLLTILSPLSPQSPHSESVSALDQFAPQFLER